MRRSKHSLSHYKLATMDMGRLVPVGLVEALPGDTLQHSTSVLIRASPLLAPVMHPVSVRLHHWFVPHRLVWEDWEDLITGGPDGLGPGTAFPTNAIAHTPVKGDLFDYMGVPVGREQPIGALSLLPIRGFNKIYNEFYRDEDLVTARGEDTTTVPFISWEKDYFTSSRPWAQKGPSVTLPLGTTAPVSTPSGFYQGHTLSDGAVRNFQTGTPAGNPDIDLKGYTGSTGDVIIDNLEADLSAATATDIRSVRQAFALQRYQEARAQYGSRYTEYLRYLGIRSSDARLQRPEYLGGGKQTIGFSEVLQTGEGVNSVGTLRGHGIAAMRSNRYRYFCEEHGYVFTLMSVRPRSMYSEGLHRTWSRRTKEDFYQKELELIGQQEVYNREVYAKGDASDAQVFGYQDRYADYRHMPSFVASDFRDVFNYWHLAREFADTPVLNQSFTDCNPTKRVFAVQTEDVLWCMISHSIQARRMVRKTTVGRVI